MLLINNQEFSWFKFPGGEIQIHLPSEIEGDRVVLTWKPKSSDDIMRLLLVVNALHHQGFNDIDLDVLYLPYNRQDRVCATGEALSLEVICNVLDTCGLSMIRFYDPHSKAHSKFLENDYVDISAADIFERYKILDNFDLNNLQLCAPDKGAIGRVDEIITYNDSKIELSAFSCAKLRMSDTGKIIDYVIGHANHNKDILVVDDICDGGSTFIHLANKIWHLLRHRNIKLYLYVTHGIFSKGLEALQKHYTHIYCHHVLDDAKHKSTERLTILREF